MSKEPYSTEAILRRNIADTEKEMQRQTERAESYADALRSLASYVGAGGYNADTVDAGVFEEKIRWGVGEIMARMEKAGAELAKLREQKPVAWCDADGDFYSGEHYPNVWPSAVPLFAARIPVPAPHKGATHCDDCGLTWLDDGLNPLWCPYCKDAVPAPAVPATCNDNLQAELRDMLQWMIGQRGKSGHAHRVAGVWDGDNGTKAGKPCAICAMYDKARALLQSAEVKS